MNQYIAASGSESKSKNSGANHKTKIEFQLKCCKLTVNRLFCLIRVVDKIKDCNLKYIWVLQLAIKLKVCQA